MKQNQESLYKTIAEEYSKDNTTTIKDLSDKYRVSYYSLYAYISKNKLVIKNKQRKIRKQLSPDLIKCYKENPSISLIELSQKYNVSVPTIKRRLKAANVEIRYPKKNINKQKLNLALQYYQSGDNSVTAAKKAGIGKHTFRTYLRDNNLLHKVISIQKDKTYNKNYFHDIDTEEKAYWLGFIFGDGSIKKSPYESSSLVIEISNDDVNHLKKFNKSISGNAIIKTRDRISKNNYISHNAYISYSGKNIVKDLAKYGCIPNKTYDGKINLSVDNTLLCAFLRGYIDADGYIAKEPHTYSFSIVVYNYKIMNFLNRAIIKLSNVIPQIRYEFSNLGGAYRIRITNKKDFFAFLDIIYKDATIYMDRKYQNYLLHGRPESILQKTLDN